MSVYDSQKMRVRRAVAEKDNPDVRRGTLADLADLHARGWVDTDLGAEDFLAQALRSKGVRKLCERTRARVAAETDQRPQSTEDWVAGMKEAR